jgi:ribosomal protein L21
MMERMRRLKIMDPATPLIDELFPLPRDNMESVPPELFQEEREELTPEGARKAQNGILDRINEQVKEKSEGRLFAVIFVNGKQFKVTPGDIIVAQGIFAPTAMDQIRFQKILLVGGKDFTLVGSPLLDHDLVRVEGTVIEKTLSYTKIIFKMIKGKNFKRFRFTKTEYTMLRINLIELRQPLEAITSDTEKFIQQQPMI